MNSCLEFADSGEMEEILCFQYQRMIRYGGAWHLERRMALPGYVFISGTDALEKKIRRGNQRRREDVSVAPCGIPYLKHLCPNGSLIGLSRGIIKDGTAVLTSGPLKGRERLIRKIDRHKRTAEILIPFDGERRQMTVGLEIYEKVT